jgi:hypothetical protein
VIKSHDVGTIQYIEWLILIDRVQPSFIAGVIAPEAHLTPAQTVLKCTVSPYKHSIRTVHSAHLTPAQTVLTLARCIASARRFALQPTPCEIRHFTPGLPL